MNIKATKKTYNKLLKDGELMDMFPTMSGDWDSDKEDFMLMYSQNLDLSTNFFDLDDEDSFNEYDYNE